MVEARPELVADIEEVARPLAVMVAVNPGIKAFTGSSSRPDGQIDRARLEQAVRFGFRVVRWHLNDMDGPGDHV
ncbi:MAG TPA: hypothetical protein VF148_18575 [Acidimicrobiia bacterium]